MTDETQKEQFLTVLEENIRIVQKIAGVYTRNARDREDLLNDITLELWKSFRKFKGNSRVSTWMYRVALNTALNFQRKVTRDKVFSSLDDLKVEPVGWLNEDDNSDKSAVLNRCIEELDDLNKAIILLYLDGNSHKEISMITGISTTNVGTRIGRIKEQLKELVIKKSDYYGLK
ncbi:RNA polymerase sigma-70 factor (ECF subfamily) [Marinilabilia salmonicolor]|jgi:RNA polymerase sigma-70 factor (ECF subfamily)|uniref:RNA polymerase sigma factor n=1 Tax=Marinilabilia salmonicolor TaxID=989 RepID=UPI000D0810FC|nr:RNA polymerase sigma factor [Marinilabilia salmonicolor]PRZ00905.1 RNA polymerase sigma-70 factor (ECF subfamily) [Marinilabilia salmonicolor]